MTTHNNDKIYIVEGKRTPFGSFGGSLKSITPVDLAVHCSKALLEQSGVKAEDIDHVILGNVVPSSTDTMYGGRHLALKIGAGIETPGYVVNRLCGSGIQAIMDAYRLIRLGESKCVLAAGSENMSMIPHLVYGSRFGTKYGSLKTVDMLLDALTDQYTQTPMGITAENLARDYKISREECDAFALLSHQKASAAFENNKLQGEITKIELKHGEATMDEHFRASAAIEDMAKLRPSFAKDGVVTPATASGIVDGAASVLIASESFCNEKGLTPIAEIIDGTVVGVEPTIMGIGPAPAITQLLERTNMTLDKIDLVEVNEAFAAQTIAVTRALKLDSERLNIWGGAVALGHPLGASGVRITHTLARQLKDTGSKRGIASACIGGGQGIAIMIETL